jgi:hypothetical protein
MRLPCPHASHGGLLSQSAILNQNTRRSRMLSPAVTSPATPTPVEEIAEAVDHIGPLHGLPSKIASGWPARARRSLPTQATCSSKRALRPQT